MMSIVVHLGNVQSRLMRFSRFTVLLAKRFSLFFFSIFQVLHINVYPIQKRRKFRTFIKFASESITCA